MMELRETIRQVIRDWWNDCLRKSYRQDLADPDRRDQAFGELADTLTFILSTRPDVPGADRPFAWRVERDRHGHVGVFPSLRDAVSAARTHGPPDEARIFACSQGGREALVEPERYSRPNPPTREEALAFIRGRAEKIRQARAAHPQHVSINELRGLFRCHPDDPEEKQIADYLRTAPRQWLPDHEIAKLNAEDPPSSQLTTPKGCS